MSTKTRALLIALAVWTALVSQAMLVAICSGLRIPSEAAAGLAGSTFFIADIVGAMVYSEALKHKPECG